MPSWRAPGSILEPPGLDFGGPGLDFGKVWDAPGQDLEDPGPTFGLFVGFPHLETPADNCGNASCLPLVGLPTFSNTT